MPGNSYGSLSGTSMATPHVSGAAVLALAVDPTLSVMALKDALLSTVDPIPSLAGKTSTGDDDTHFESTKCEDNLKGRACLKLANRVPPAASPWPTHVQSRPC